jgi:hypothetical protein
MGGCRLVFVYLVITQILIYMIACKADVGGVLGVKDSMIAHILGKNSNNPCLNASEEAQKTARTAKKGKKKRGREKEGEDSDSENDGEKKRVKRKLLTNVEATLKQSRLKVFHGIQVPFTEEQAAIVHEHFPHATISVNLPFRWVDDPEVILLFMLFQSTAATVMPSRQQISGELLDSAHATVTKRLKGTLQGKYAVLASDGWKDESRDSVNGINLSIGGRVSCLFPSAVNAYSPFVYKDLSCQSYLGHVTQKRWRVNVQCV